jgi:hypothetical protein
MLDVSRLDAIVCTTALEVELLAALVRERRLRGLVQRERKPKSKDTRVWPKVYGTADFCGPRLPANEYKWIPANKATVVQIQAAVAQRWVVSVADIRSSRRTAEVMAPRQIATMLCRTLTLLSYPQLARKFGNRDHTTMLHNAKRMEWLRQELVCELRVHDSVWSWVEAAHERYHAVKAQADVTLLGADPIDIPAFPMNGQPHG